ncbi:hypothetical protein CVT25_011217 [Psilocybe cyanescens]|uniref:Uncharacterized protein n=1 Tax=Psilocybe cyanescens TaxID=93625 RepID=A0A409WGZ4_PSICY|nr:hypothetical protein CVT25_011217 [Psilocybe cyanescens]
MLMEDLVLRGASTGARLDGRGLAGRESESVQSESLTEVAPMVTEAQSTMRARKRGFFGAVKL